MKIKLSDNQKYVINKLREDTTSYLSLNQGTRKSFCTLRGSSDFHFWVNMGTKKSLEKMELIYRESYHFPKSIYKLTELGKTIEL